MERREEFVVVVIVDDVGLVDRRRFVAVEKELKRMKILGEFSSFPFTFSVHTYIIVSHFKYFRLLVRAK